MRGFFPRAALLICLHPKRPNDARVTEALHGIKHISSQVLSKQKARSINFETLPLSENGILPNGR